METVDIKTALDEQGLKNHQESSFIRLWKWQLVRLNQLSLKLKAPITIGVEFDRNLKQSALIGRELGRNFPSYRKILLRPPHIPRS